MAILRRVPWEVEFNFRATKAFITDRATGQADPTFVNGGLGAAGTQFPQARTTGNGTRFGWIGSADDRDRTADDARVAGFAFVRNPANATFQVELPEPGAYLVWLLLGDRANQGLSYASIKDDTRTLVSLNGVDTGISVGDGTALVTITGHVCDVPGWLHNSVNNPLRLTFNSRTLNITLGDLVLTNSAVSAINNLRIVKDQTQPPGIRYFIAPGGTITVGEMMAARQHGGDVMFDRTGIEPY